MPGTTSSRHCLPPKPTLLPGPVANAIEQAQIARTHGWGCRAGVFLEAEHTDEKSWAYAEEERQDALQNGEKPPLVPIYREALMCPLDVPPSCRITAARQASS